jgi:hypothetical protein
MDTLNNTTGITASGELFIPLQDNSKKKHQSSLLLIQTREKIQSYPRFQSIKFQKTTIRPFSVFSFLNLFFDYPDIVGYKLMYSQLILFPEIWIYVLLKKIKIIHLIRRNLFDVIISKEIRKITETPHFDQSQTKIQIPKITLDPKNTLKKIKLLNRNCMVAHTLLNIFQIQYLEIIYENLLKDPSEYIKIYEFLSIKENQVEIKSNYKKINTKDHSQIISNYVEIKKILSNTEYEWMIK